MKRRGRGNPLAPVLRAYAETHRCSLRTAQNHCRANNASWIEFRAKAGIPDGAGEAMDSGDEKPGVVPSVAPAPSEDEPIEWTMEREHRTLWRKAVDMAKAATDAGQIASASHFGKLAREQLAACEQASRARTRRDLLARDLIPRAEWDSLMETIQRIAGLVTGLDRDLPDRVNPDNPGVAAAAIRQWLESRWNPALSALEAMR